MPTYPVNLGPFRSTRVAFFPYGAVILGRPSTKINPWAPPEPQYSAQLLVGFNVGGKPTYKLQDLITLVAELTPDNVTFLSTHGLFTSRKASKARVQEEGAQVIIINEGYELEVFKKKMHRLAQRVRAKLRQELVVLNLQKDGVVVATAYLVPAKRAKVT